MTETDAFSFDHLLEVEKELINEGLQLGAAHGEKNGFSDGESTGITQGSEIGSELGHYQGAVLVWTNILALQPDVYSKRTHNVIQKLSGLICTFPKNPTEDNFDETLGEIRRMFKQANASMKGPNTFHKEEASF